MRLISELKNRFDWNLMVLAGAVLLMAAGPLLYFSAPASALEIPPSPAGYVADYAGLLSAHTESYLNQALTQYERETSNQIVVAVFPSLEEESLEDFSLRLATAWGIGTAEHDNGILLTVFRDDRKMRIEVGYGLEGAVTDAESGGIIRNVIAPYFQKGNYDQGITAAVAVLMREARGEYTGVGSTQAQQKGAEEPPLLIKILFVVFFIPLFLYVMIRHPWIFFLLLMNNGRTYGGGRGGPYGGGFGGGGFSGGGGFGGFSGGGGSFGGGGASGGW